ncbi:MAG: thiolase [Deltaproteobacteria bacterium]|nr:thiolase [Deltaproteobacteria bacterium]MBW2386153.1 thiolase [Deltaproteobacteria bacterium]
MSFKDRTAIVGVGLTPYGKRGEFFDIPQSDQIRGALQIALTESGLDLKEIDGFCSYSVDGNDPGMLAPALGIPNVCFSNMVFGGGGGGTCGAIANAAAAIHAGLAEVVMCFKIITQPPHMRFGASYGSKAIAANPYSDFHRPFGLISPVQFMAMLVRRHMHRFGTRPEHLAEVAVSTRAHASRNPLALKRGPLTIEDHQQSRMIADPFRLFDCCQENDGGGVILVTSAERARDLEQQPVYIMAGAQGGSSRWGHGLTMQNQPEDLYTSAGHKHLADRLYKMAGVAPEDVDVALLYDHFSGLVILQLEDYGFCKPGEGGPFVEDGALSWKGGRLPVNTHGGNLSEVYLLGLTHIAEAVRQLRGESTSQVEGAEIALVTSGPSNLPTSSLILRR